MIQEYNHKIDTQIIRGYLYRPDNVADKLPLVILSHGFFANYTWMTYYAEELVKQDIICYLFDFRGGGPDTESDGTLEESSVLTELQDLNTIIRNLSEHNSVDKDRIYLLGHSQGGLVSALAATQNSIRAMFLLAPAYNIPEEMRNTKLPQEGKIIKHPVGIFTRKYITDARKIKIYDDVNKFSNKVYIFHGKNDNLVPLNYVKQAQKQYPDAQLKIIENENHNFTKKAKEEVKNIIIKEIKG